jgi:hypothetical protein
MIPKSGNRFAACAKPLQRLVLSFIASAGEGEGRSDKIMRKRLQNARPNYFRDVVSCPALNAWLHVAEAQERIFFNAVSAEVRFEMVRT